MEAAIKRILPHSTEAEQAVVGAMLMDKDAIMVAAEMLTGRISIRVRTECCLMRW